MSTTNEAVAEINNLNIIENNQDIEEEKVRSAEGEEILWKVLDDRFPAKLVMDAAGEALSELFPFVIKKGEQARILGGGGCRRACLGGGAHDPVGLGGAACHQQGKR